MSVATTLIWLEFKRTTWVFYGTLVGFSLYLFVLLSLPAVVTGLDVLGLPATGSETQPCNPPDCETASQSKIELSRESGGGDSSVYWSFSRTWGGESQFDSDTPREVQGSTATVPSGTEIAIPEELQLAFRPRQLLTAAAALILPGLMLLGFWIAHYREADRGEMTLLYQSPVSGRTQLALRFLFMSSAAALVLCAVLAIYWFVQTSESLAPLAPVAEAFGGRSQIHWGGLSLAILATQILPNVAFILLFVQMHNAYNLLGGQRLVGLILTVAALSLSVLGYTWASVDPESTNTLLRIVSVESNPSLDGMVSSFEPDRYRVDIPMRLLALCAGISLAMLVLSSWIWREVEWS